MNMTIPDDRYRHLEWCEGKLTEVLRELDFAQKQISADAAVIAAYRAEIERLKREMKEGDH